MNAQNDFLKQMEQKLNEMGIANPEELMIAYDERYMHIKRTDSLRIIQQKFKAFFTNNQSVAVIRTPILINNSMELSVQASKNHYCSPRNNIGPYTSFEVKASGVKISHAFIKTNGKSRSIHSYASRSSVIRELNKMKRLQVA